MVKTKTDDMPFSCDCYLLEGSHWALAIDSGMQLPDIAEYMSLLTDKPILGAVSYTHLIYGEVTGYPVSYKNFAADDDSNGPLFFIRALEDCKDLSAFSASDVADALLNYAPYELSLIHI